MSQRCIPHDPSLHHTLAEHGQDHVSAWAARLGFSIDTWICSSMSVPQGGDPMQRTSSMTGSASIASSITAVIPSFAQTHTQGLASNCSNASPCLISDLLTHNSNKQVILFQSSSWSHLTQGAGLCSTVCPLLLLVFTWLQGDKHFLASLQESCGLIDRWANISCVNVFLQFPCF